jgi:radical SAM superfamily enzyme YgiQ (UPF0313 family)
LIDPLGAARLRDPASPDRADRRYGDERTGANPLFGSIQISRGCPFLCEFCDIIVTFGRRPRLKTTARIIAELEALRTSKINTVFIVDDNFIGNKRIRRRMGSCFGFSPKHR